ncbi:hypothetical protein AVEN_170601-1 [Araneus ventricosus]|uniref:Uncharacterized protein n=1 Tax=Araneus ventricosus TaxID=182803 RepID=A0A4Y2J1W8_ARAVE|nr:hypothetical protein AVEN_170601-1 [Araneus ventricosus]
MHLVFTQSSRAAGNPGKVGYSSRTRTWILLYEIFIKYRQCPESVHFVHDLLRLSGKTPPTCQMNAGAGVQSVYAWVYTSSDMVVRTTAVRLAHCVPRPLTQDAYLRAPRSYNQPSYNHCVSVENEDYLQEHCSRETPSTTFGVRLDSALLCDCESAKFTLPLLEACNLGTETPSIKYALLIDDRCEMDFDC